VVGPWALDRASIAAGGEGLAGRFAALMGLSDGRMLLLE